MILTAAHCTFKKKRPIKPAKLFVVSGKTKSKLWFFIGIFQSRRVKKYIVHEEYSTRTYTNDIAIFVLKKELKHYERKIFPIALPDPNLFKTKEPWDYFKGDCTAIGWGRLQFQGEKTNVLHVVDLPLISNDKCREHKTGIRSSKQICTLDPKGGKDACQGDSGGPLVCYDNKITYQLGIVSYGRGCGSPSDPGVWTRIDKYMDWIRNVTKTNKGSNNFSKNIFINIIVSVYAFYRNLV